MSLNITEVFANISGGKTVATDGVPEVSLEIPFDLDLSGEVDSGEPESLNMAEEEPAEIVDLGADLPTQAINLTSTQTYAQIPDKVSAAIPTPHDPDSSLPPITKRENVSLTFVDGTPAVASTTRASEVAVTFTLPIQTSQSSASANTPAKFVNPASSETMTAANPDDSKLVKLAGHDPKKDDFLLPRTDEAPRLAEQPNRSFIAPPNVKADTTAEIASGAVSKSPTQSPPQNFLFDVGLAILGEQPEAPLNWRPSATSFQSVHSSQRVPVSPQMIATQISTSISKGSGNLIEIRLDPPELGRLIVSIAQGESGVSAHVSAERLDVAEFLRRNADILTQELEKSGFGGASLEFSYKEFSQNDGDGDADKGGQTGGPAPHEMATSRNPQINYILHGSLDIRL